MKEENEKKNKMRNNTNFWFCCRYLKETYFDNIWPPASCNWWHCRSSCRAASRCCHDGCSWIMSWWEIFMVEQLLCIVKFQFWYRISVVCIHLWIIQIIFWGNNLIFLFFLCSLLWLLSFRWRWWHELMIFRCCRCRFVCFFSACFSEKKTIFFIPPPMPITSSCLTSSTSRYFVAIPKMLSTATFSLVLFFSFIFFFSTKFGADHSHAR